MTTLAAKQRLIFTAEQFYALGDGHAGYELIDGRREVNPLSAKSCRIGGILCQKLLNHCDRVPGWVFPQESGFQCFADETERVRKPDTAFIAFDRMSVADYEADGFIRIVPDLVVEVVSPKDNASKVESKIDQWLLAGVKVVWVVYPNQKRIREHRPDGSVRHFLEAHELVESTLLPGFACPVADLFKLPGAPAPTSAA